MEVEKIKIARISFIISIFLVSLEIYRLPLIFANASLSQIFQLLGLIFFILVIFDIIKAKVKFKVKKQTIYIWMVICVFLLTSILNLILYSQDFEVGFDFILIELVGSVFVLVLPILFNNYRDFNIIYKAFYFSAFFSYLLNMYALYYWLKYDEIMSSVPFWKSFSKSESTINYLNIPLQFQSFPRFRFPFSSTGSTGVFLAISGIFILNEVFRSHKNKKFYIFVFVVNLFFLIGTFSRAGWIIFFIGVLSSLYYMHNFKLLRLITITKLAIVWFLIILIPFIFIPNMFDIFLERFSLETTAQSNLGHLKTRIIGINKFINNPIRGIGIGNLSALGYGVHTHSVYTSFLAERGLLIFVLYIFFLTVLLKLLREKMYILMARKKYDSLILNISMYSALLAVVFGHFLYQIDSYMIWLFYALALSYFNLNNEVQFYKSESSV